jgi:hypothetical protein
VARKASEAQGIFSGIPWQPKVQEVISGCWQRSESESKTHLLYLGPMSGSPGIGELPYSTELSPFTITKSATTNIPLQDKHGIF